MSDPEPTPDPETLLGLPQAAERAGVPYSTLYFHARTGDLNGVHRIGAHLYVTRAGLREYIGERTLEGRFGSSSGGGEGGD